MSTDELAQELSADEQRAIQELADYVAQQLAEGRSQAEVTNELVENGWEQADAAEFVVQVDGALQQAVHQAKGSQYVKHIWIGALWAIGGTAVTVATYSAASDGGGYVIAWGAIIFGVIESLYGIFGWLTNR